MVANNSDASSMKEDMSVCSQERIADVGARDTSMKSVFSASLTKFMVSSNGADVPPSGLTEKQITALSESCPKSSTDSSDEDEWVILEELDKPLTKTPATEQVQDTESSKNNAEVNYEKEQPGVSFSVPEASQVRHLEESMSAPETCRIRDLENRVISIETVQNESLLNELQDSLRSLHAKYTALHKNYNQLKVEAENSKSKSSLTSRENEVLLQQREDECRKLRDQLDSVSRKAKQKKDKMADDFNRRLHELRNEMHAVLNEKEAVANQLEKARQDLIEMQKSNLSSLSQHDLVDESSAIKDQLEKTKKALVEMSVKLREVCEQADAEKREHNCRLKQLADQSTPSSLLPGVSNGSLGEQVEFLERKLKETWDDHALQLTTVEQKLLRDNSKFRAKHSEFQLKYEKQKEKTKTGYDKIKHLRQLVSSLQAFKQGGHSNHMTKTNGIVQQRFDSVRASDWLKIWTNPIKRERQLQQIFHEVQATDGGPDGGVKDHVFFQKVILFIWNQRNESRQKLMGFQQKMEQLDGEKQVSDRLELEALQEQLSSAITENSTMETSYNQTIDQLVSENKELQVKIKHLEKTISALHHDNNLWRLEMDKIRSKDQSLVIDKKTDLSDSRVMTLKAEVECVRQHCSLLKAEVSSTKKRNENLTARLTQMEEEGQQYLEQLKGKQQQTDRLEITIKTLEKQMDRANDELEKGRTSLTSLVAKKQVADTRIKELEKKLKEVIQDNEQLLLDNSQLPIIEEVITKTEVRNLEQQNTNDRVEHLQNDIFEREREITMLEIELKSAREQVDVLQKQIKNQPKKVVPEWMNHEAWHDMISEKQKLKNELIEIKEKMLWDNKELTELRQEHGEVQSKLGLAVQKSEMEGLKKKLQLEEEKMMLRMDVDGKLRSASIKEKELKQELDEQKKMVIECQMKINRIQNELRLKENEANSLNQELAIMLNENVLMKRTLETVTTENSNKLMEVGALTTQLQEEKGKNEKTRHELEHMLCLVSKDSGLLGHDRPNELGTITTKPTTDGTTIEELMIKLTQARIESGEIKHKLQTAEKKFHLEETMNRSMREQHEKSSMEKNSMERTLDLLQVEKLKWLDTESQLNKQIDKLCKEREKYMQELLQAKKNAEKQRNLFLEATKKQKETAEKYEYQLNDTSKQWNEEKKDLEEQKDQLKEETQSMKENIAEKEGRLKASEETIKQLNEDRRAKEIEASSLNQELSILLNENALMKKTIDTITTENSKKFMEVGALTTQLQQEKGKNEKTRHELEHMLCLVSKDSGLLGHDRPNELGAITAKAITDVTTREELMIKLTEARIESAEIKHKLQTAEKNFHLEKTMNKSLREQHERSSNEKSNMEKALDTLQVEKMKWLETETQLNQQIDKLCKEREQYMKELLQTKQNADQQRNLFLEADKKQKETAKKYECQLTDTSKRWNEEKKDLEEQKDRLKEEKQSMKEKVAEKEGRLYALEETIKQLNEDKRANLELRSKLASTKSRLSDMEATIEKLTLERDRYADETTQLQQSLKNTEENKTMMESLVEEKEKALSDQRLSYSERLTTMTNRLQKTQNSLATVREGLQQARDTNTSLTKERSDLLAKLDSLREAWEADKMKLAVTEERFTNMESKQMKTMLTLNEVQESNKTLNSSLLDLDSKLSMEKTKVKMLLEHESELETRIKSYDMRLKILDEQVNYYKKRLSKEESRLQQARGEILKNNNEAAHEKQKKM
ncbi:COP1-interactive protein 1-like [Anneissia japonica]|uniref:COP1-interactive protein 1-like n=1 Tax=Anneissia japonica TaxID=1529436 RepID=UPI0014259B82|nr:COP1-interactive protein 1-like [Anneissia japonica]